jgi:hypothetical protein
MFWVLMAIAVSDIVFWDVVPGGLETFTDVSENVISLSSG